MIVGNVRELFEEIVRLRSALLVIASIGGGARRENDSIEQDVDSSWDSQSDAQYAREVLREEIPEFLKKMLREDEEEKENNKYFKVQVRRIGNSEWLDFEHGCNRKQAENLVKDIIENYPLFYAQYVETPDISEIDRAKFKKRPV